MSVFCKGVTKEGYPCQRLVTQGSYCWQHIDNAECLQITELSGPSKFVYYRDILDRRILLLGELHIEAGLCQSEAFQVDKWISELADQGHCIDVFVESPYIISVQHGEKLSRTYKTSYQLISPLYRMVERFPEAHQYVRQIETQRLRYHPIDLREFDTEYLSAMSLFLHIFGQVISRIFLENGQEQYNPHRKGLYQFLLGLNSQYKSIYEGLIENVKVVALAIASSMGSQSELELQQIHNSCETNRCFIQKYIERISRMLKKMDGRINHRKLREIMLQVYLDEQINHNDMYQTLNQIPMDLYCLLRLFSVYDPQVLVRGPPNCRGEESLIHKYSIILTGQAHTAIYEAVINKYFEVMPNISITNNLSDQNLGDFQCIHLPHPFNFFS